MPLKNPFKLEKLKIKVFGDRKRSRASATFELMFNPSSFSMKHQNVFDGRASMGASGQPARYSHSRSDSLALNFIFDGTGVGVFGGSFATSSVSERISAFLDACFHMDGSLHEPKYLKIQWGDGALRNFDCRLKSVDIKYTSFEKSGAPLRAELAAVFIEDLDPNKRAKEDRKSSPDLSHLRTVKSGDSIPLLCKEIYGSSRHYLMVATVNGLDHFRNLEPGMELRFPPLDAEHTEEEVPR